MTNLDFVRNLYALVTGRNDCSVEGIESLRSQREGADAMIGGFGSTMATAMILLV
jgi:hypothetical protein